jgi:hypothetical protein
MSHSADRVVDELDIAMRRLREAMRGIPIRRGSFRNTHTNLVRDVAKATTMMDAARPLLRKK